MVHLQPQQVLLNPISTLSLGQILSKWELSQNTIDNCEEIVNGEISILPHYCDYLIKVHRGNFSRSHVLSSNSFRVHAIIYNFPTIHVCMDALNLDKTRGTMRDWISSTIQRPS